MFKKLIIFLIIITIGVFLGIIGFHHYTKNIFSEGDIRLEVLAPGNIEAFEKFEYLVRIRNLSEAILEDAFLTFVYPENSLTAETPLRIRKRIQDIYPGQEKSFSFPARLLGKDGEAKTARALLSYRPRGLEAFFESNTNHTALIEFTPLTLGFDLVSRIESPRLINFSINYFSNSPIPLSDLEIRMEYPLDFEFLESQPPPLLGEKEWGIGLLNQGQGGRIEIKGNVIGEIGEIKNFKAQLGIWQEGRFIILKETIRAIEIIKPFIYISQKINNSAHHIAKPGQTLHFQIFFKNIGEKFLENLSLVISLESEILDYYSLFAEKGRFRKGGNVIILDYTIMPELKFLGPMDQGIFEFWIDAKLEPVPYLKNPIIKNTITLGHVRKEFVTKVSSILGLEQTVYFEQGPFRNSGPIPPQINMPTTYTIIWQPQTSYNQINNIEVRSTLPLGVEPTGEFLPKEAQFFFDTETRELVWKIEELLPDKENLDIKTEIAFQLILTPQKRKETFKLIEQTYIKGEDQWAGITLETAIPNLNTGLADKVKVEQEVE